MNHLTSADYHLGHGKIIEYCNRPFSTSFQMNEAIIARHNERVKPDDMFYFLGDFCYKAGLNCDKAEDWLARLNGNKIMIRGNHDNNNSCKTIIDCMHITFANRRINMVHKPTHANPNFEINLCGHVHDKWRIQTYAQQYQKLSDIVSGKYGVEKEYWRF